MDYLLNKDGRYYYQRRVPVEFKQYDSRSKVRFSLNTRDKAAAAKLATIQNHKLEEYWKLLVGSGQRHHLQLYQDTVRRADLYGFAYKPQEVLASAELGELIRRMLFVQNAAFNQIQVEAVTGGVEKPSLLISELLPKYWEFSEDKLRNKSPNQIRKYRHARIRAFRNLTNVIGDKEVCSITRNDMLKFKRWWQDRLKAENMVVDSANKNFNQLRAIFGTLNDELQLGLNIDLLFKNLTIKQRRRKTKKPFDTTFLKTKLLQEETLKGLNEEAKWALYAISETGCRLTEICGLKPSDIVLNAPIPYIHICDREEKETKTVYSDRKIPLVGFALDAFQRFPSGFPRYFDKADQLSGALSAYLTENNLLQKGQTTYSLRHSFQDRLLHAEALDRVQADLMGHKFNRPDYGDGSTLRQKLKWLKKIQLKSELKLSSL